MTTQLGKTIALRILLGWIFSPNGGPLMKLSIYRALQESFELVGTIETVSGLQEQFSDDSSYLANPYAQVISFALPLISS